MNHDFMREQLLTNSEIAQLLRRWETRVNQPSSTAPTGSWAKYAVQWRPPSSSNPAIAREAAMSVADARKVIDESMRLYFDDPEIGGLLVTAQAGTGKSTSAIRFAQEMAKQGFRVLYLMPRHSYWKDIEESPFYEEGLWHHWKATHATDPETGERMCKLHQHSAKFMRKGYRLIDMCKGLCLDNGHMSKCPYRAQANLKTPIIAGVHQHATYGLGIAKFDLVIVDELPLSAFVGERLIKTRNIDSDGKGPIGKLLGAIRDVAIYADGRVDTHELLSQIAEPLRAVYEYIDDEDLSNESHIRDTSQVDKMREWYLDTLITLLIPELVAFERGLTNWLSRVYVDKEGLHLMVKRSPWLSLPPKVIALDATGRTELYEQLFNVPFTRVEPNVRLVGRLHQVANSLNSISQIVKDDEGEKRLSWRGRELLALTEFISSAGGYSRTAAMVYKAIRSDFEEVLGKRNVLHFGGSRGTNHLVDDEDPVDCLIVAGSPAPPDEDIMQLASQIWFDPTSPESSMITLGDSAKQARGSTLVEYAYVREDGLAPYRMLGGFWSQRELEIVLKLFREDELRQALHRGRPITRQCDIWLLTSVPTVEPLTSFYENPNEIFSDMTAKIGWRNWHRVKSTLTSLEKGSYHADDLAHLLGTKSGYAKTWSAAWAELNKGYEWDAKSFVLTKI